MNESFIQSCQSEFIALLKEQTLLTQDFLSHMTNNYDIALKLQDSAWGWHGANLKDEHDSE